MKKGEDDDYIGFLRAELEKEESKLAKMESPVDRQREIVRSRRAALAAAQTGTFSSRDISDDEIVQYVCAHATEQKPLSAPEIAAGLGLDTRGLSRRLPRMVADRLLMGSPETGYWCPPGRMA